MPGAGINTDGFPLYHCWVLSSCQVEFLWLHGAVLWAWGLPAPCRPSHHGHPRGIFGNTPFLPSQVQALPLFPLPQAYKERISKLPIFLIIDVLGFVVVVVSLFHAHLKTAFRARWGSVSCATSSAWKANSAALRLLSARGIGSAEVFYTGA